MKKILFTCMLLLGFLISHAQQITGKVLDKENSEPLIGVSISIEGSTSGTITDIDGNYSIVAKEGDVLIFSYIGMLSQKATVGKNKNITVYLSPNSQVLDEVVAVGYGTMRRKDLTGAISSLSGTEVEKTTSSSALGGLAGKLPGVQVIQNSGTPGGDISIRVRGVGTINGADPLYVVDGVPVSGGIWYLNPSDIQTIDVLKDASATAIYGARGANGVVMVTTKKGMKGQNVATVDYSYGFQKVAKLYDMMNASQYAALHNDMRTNAAEPLNPAFADPQSLGAGTDWLDQIFHTAPMQKVTASMSGGDKTLYSVSASYYQQDGVLKNTGYDRVTMQANLQTEFNSKFRLSTNMMFSGEKRDQQDAYTVIENAMRILPNIPVYDENGNFAGPTGSAPLNGDAINPVGIISTQTNQTDAYRGLANISLEYDITDWLQFKTLGGTEAGYGYTNNFYPKYKWGNAQMEETKQTGNSSYDVLLLWDNTLTFKKKIDKHSINAFVGTSFQDFKNRWVGATGVGRASDGVKELTNALKADKVDGSSSGWAMMSYMGRINYIYDNKYNITASLRADGSSIFGENNQYGYFPSFAGAWTASNEGFMKDIKTIDFLKLRIGYGVVGNQDMTPYIALDRLDVKGQYNFGSARGFNSVAVGTIYPYMLSNKNLQWEETKQFNIGFDMAILESRISFTTDFYSRTLDKMMVPAPVPQTSGFTLEKENNPNQNIGKARNMGVEFTINTINFQTKDFNWTTGLNLAFNKNEILDLKDNQLLEYYTLEKKGYPIHAFYGYAVDHIYQNVDDVFSGPAMENRAADRSLYDPTKGTAPGDIAFRKFTEGDVLTDEDRVVIGDPNPWFTGGLNNSITYKNLDFSFMFQAVYGNEIFNEVRMTHEGMSATYNQFTSTLNRWTGEGKSYDMPRAVYADPNKNNRPSDRFVEDGSYLKLKNVTIGYKLPGKWLNPLSIESLRIYANMDNLLTFTNYSGLDPEVGPYGKDNVIYPPSRTFLFGVNVQF